MWFRLGIKLNTASLAPSLVGGCAVGARSQNSGFIFDPVICFTVSRFNESHYRPNFLKISQGKHLQAICHCGDICKLNILIFLLTFFDSKFTAAPFKKVEDDPWNHVKNSGDPPFRATNAIQSDLEVADALDKASLHNSFFKLLEYMVWLKNKNKWTKTYQI